MHFLQDNIFSRIKKDFIKRGFCRGFYTRLEGQEGDNISVLDFWEKFGFKETLGELILNESNTD
jgi:hypothetical protein